MRKMRIFLPLLSVLCVAQGRSIFDGTCPRRDPPPGVLVLSTGSKLVLTCKGHVTVDGIKVSIAQNSSNTNRRGSAPAAPTTTGNITNSKHTMNSIVNEGDHFGTTAEVSTVKGENTSLGYTDAAYTATPTSLMVQPTSVGRLLKGQSDWEAEEVDGEGDYEEDEEEEGEESSRVTRGIKSRPLWKWNGKIVGNGDTDWGEITFERRGATLSLSSVRVTDSGRYTCHHRSRERFSLKVVVAEPPEKPSLSCYKKSPSSKIRCEWTPQRPVTRQSKCYLIANKRPSDAFFHLLCSYSSRLARYWCTLDHNEDELRTIHMAFLCVTSITGNATSSPLHFIPMDILKPDPPSNVKVEQEVGHKTWLNVTWNFPTSWKHQDRFYELIYEVKYRPLESSFYHDQIKTVERSCSHTITDVMPGVKYLIQLRTRDEYDGQWSDWTTPIISSSWTAPTLSDDLITTTFPASTEEGSCADDYMPETPTPTNRSGLGKSYPILWLSGSFVLLSVILAAYIFRHRDRFMSKLHRVSVIIQSSESSHLPPAPPAAPGGQALVTFSPPLFKDHPPSKAEEEDEEEDEEEENEEEQRVKERIEAMHFNNTSYFLIQRE